MTICKWARSTWVRQALLMLVIACFVAGIDGCTRAFYRKRADNEVNDILNEKNKYPEWQIEQYHVYPDPRARFADPTNPDHPPMPPDDEAAFNLSPHPQAPGHAGVATVEGTGYLEMLKVWDEQNRVEMKSAAEKVQQQIKQEQVAGGALESRTGPIKAYFDEPLNAERSGFVLTLEQAVELGVVNSRTYQNFREELYEVALPVTAQRYSFAYQWAASEDAIRRYAGPLFPGGQQNSWALGSKVGFSKLFSTGALLTLQFANNTVFDFTSHGYTSASSINLNAIQPLLQGGGRAVTLEPLTQAERNLFYAIRSYARFREQFFVSVAIGTNLPNTLFAVSAATGSPISALAALGIASTDVSGGFVGYLSTLFREVDMAVDKKWVSDLEKAVILFEGLEEGGQVSPLQVSQVRSQALSGENTVLNDLQNFSNALDQFKLVLGVPANMPLILDDTTARPVTQQLDRYYQVIADADAAYKLVEKQDQLPPGKLREFLREVFTKDVLVRGTPFQKKLPATWDAWAKLKDEELKPKLDKLREEHRKLLDEKTDLAMKKQALTAEQERALTRVEFDADVGDFEKSLREYEAKPWEKQPNDLQKRAERTKRFRLLAYNAELILVWARNDRFDRVGQLWPQPPAAMLDSYNLLTLNEDTAQQVAVLSALSGRWELMNARAQLVDSWRQIRVTANALLGVLDVGYTLQAVTDPLGKKPLAFSSARTENQLSLNFQLPLNRLLQRNAYRTALLNYQLARRNLMALEDTIAAQVRFDVRQLHLFAANYRIQQKNLESLYSQVENALEVIVAPADPDALKQTGTSGQANAAALTNQYLSALNSLNNAQTKMYDIWLSYQATRMQLYLDLERMPLDNRGVWIDESGNAEHASCAGASEPLGPPRTLEPGTGQSRNAPAGRGDPAADTTRSQPPAGAEWRPNREEPVQPVRLLPPITAQPRVE
jgi:hypothetical protein